MAFSKLSNEAQACSQQSSQSPKTAFTVLMPYKLLRIMLQFTDKTFVVGGLHCSTAFLLAMEEINYSHDVWTYFVKSMEVFEKKKKRI